MKEPMRSRVMLIASMGIFGTVGIFRRYIPLPSGVIAMLRGAVGALFLLIVMLAGRQKPARAAIRQELPRLCISGAVMGFNWILLFEAYNHTSVATATLCYYMAPIFTILASPFVLGEKLTVRRLGCVGAALIGMVLVSGVADAGFGGIGELTGVALGLGAAALYATLVLINKRMRPLPAYDKTVTQLLSAAAVLAVYTLVTGEWSGLTVSPLTAVLLAVVCVVHTGVAYALYFGSMEHLPAHTLALFSYLDPVLAVLLSAFLLHEPMTPATAVGAVLILAGAMISELPARPKKN